MKFYLQQGYGMMGLNVEFANKYDDLGVILAPRALQSKSPISTLENHAKKLKKAGVRVLFDSQFYVPRTNIRKILKFPYFDIGYDTVDFTGNASKEFCKRVVDYQLNNMDVDDIILPSRYVNSITKDWYKMQENFVEAHEKDSYPQKTYLTLALGPDVVNNKAVFDDLIDKCIYYPVDGYYFVLKSPNNNFLIDNQVYLYALLDAFISLRVAGKDVILGYSNQQDIIYSAAGVETIATGTFRNVRSFDPDIFMESDEEEIKRKGTWYFDGLSLSEFKQQQLTLAYRRGLKGSFGPSCEYCEELLESSNPATVLWKENKAFRHYLTEIRKMWYSIGEKKVNNRLDHVINILETVRLNNKELRNKGFAFGNRGFDDNILDASLGALNAIKVDRKYDIQSL